MLGIFGEMSVGVIVATAILCVVFGGLFPVVMGGIALYCCLYSVKYVDDRKNM